MKTDDVSPVILLPLAGSCALFAIAMLIAALRASDDLDKRIACTAFSMFFAVLALIGVAGAFP